jgi:hypothetical protein
MNDLLRRQLGPRARMYAYAVRGMRHEGWRAPASFARRAVERVAAELRAREDTRLLLTDGGREQLALPGLPVLDVVEVARVGTHQGDEDAWRDVRDGLAEVFELAPFDVTFADEAGLEAVFWRPIDDPRARAVARVLIERNWLDSIALMAEEGDELADDDDPLVTYLARRNRLRLCWD